MPAAAPGFSSVIGWQLTVLLCEGTERRLQWAFCDMLINRREMSRGRAKMLTFQYAENRDVLRKAIRQLPAGRRFLRILHIGHLPFS